MIREQIKNRIKRLGITSIAVCADLGFKASNFSSYLKGQRAIPFVDLERLCSYLGLTLERNDEETEDVKVMDSQE